MNLTHRLFLLVAVALLPAIAIQGYNEFDLRRSREAEIRALALRQAELAASEVEQIISGTRGLLSIIGEVPSVRALDTPACVAFLQDLQPKVAHLLTIAALDLEGRVACRQELPQPDLRFADRPYFQQAIATGTFVIGEYTFGRSAKQPVLPLALPLRDAQGRIVGVVAAALDLRWLSNHLHERSLPEGDSITIADRNGVILAREPFPERFVGTRIPDPFMHLVTAPAPGALELVSQDQTRRMLGYIPIGSPPVQGLYVSVGLGAHQAFAAIDRATTRGIALIAAGMAAAFGMAWVVGRRFLLQPMGALLAAARRWRGGDYSSRSGLTGRAGEFGALGAEFDGMAAEIARREAERDHALEAAQESEARLRAVVESLPFEFWVIDAEGRYVLQNPVSRANWGDRIGRRPQDTDTPPALLDAWLENNRRALSGEIVRTQQSWQVNGEVRHVEKIIAPILAGTRLLGAVGLNIDVTERHKAEQRQRQLTSELDHRVRNMLATIQAIARLTLTDGRPIDEARNALGDRLRALAMTYDLLVANDWRGASLRAIATNELGAFRTRSRVEGADVVLAPQAAQTVGMVLHELATNAARHGALSGDDGTVTLAWDSLDAEDGPVLSLRWTEAGGPPVTEPRRRGLGRDLIEAVAARQLKGKATLEFGPGGLAYRLDAPLQAIAAPPSSA